MRDFILLFLHLLLVTVLAACGMGDIDEGAYVNPEVYEMPEIVFMKSGKVSHDVTVGEFIDNEGNIKRFGSYASGGYNPAFYHDENYDFYDYLLTIDDVEKIGEVDLDTLHARFEQLLKVSNEDVEETITQAYYTDAIYESTSLVGYKVNQDGNRESLLIYEDYIIIKDNKGKDAQKLFKWLKDELDWSANEFSYE